VGELRYGISGDVFADLAYRIEYSPDTEEHLRFLTARQRKIVFDAVDEQFVTVIDDEHSDDEERYITIGLSRQARLLVVAHTDRTGQVRIISARKATRKEEQFYAEAE